MKIDGKEIKLQVLDLHQLYLLKNLLASVGRRSAVDLSEGDSAIWAIIEEFTEEEMVEIMVILTGLDEKVIEKNFSLSWLVELVSDWKGLVSPGSEGR